MLNEEKDTDRTTGSAEDISIHSLVSEDNEFDPWFGQDNAERKSNNGEENHKLVGLLIVEGEEGNDDENNDDDVTLSIPETVFLPSEIGSVTAVSCVTHEENEDNNHTGKILWKKWRRSSFVSSWRSCLVSFGSFNTMQVMSALIICMALVSLFASLSSHNIWKNEALRLREDLQKQKTLLPLTLSLMKEREALLRKQKLLEDAIETAEKKSSWSSNYEDIFPPGESDDGAILSINNCYVEASLSLGRCSKEWQGWWSPSTGDDSTERADSGEESYDDGFTEDMSKLVKSFTNGLAETTTQSYSFLEKTLKDLSYDGIKDASLARFDYVQSIFQPTLETTSNDTEENMR